jgi:hypothetical protein
MEPHSDILSKLIRRQKPTLPENFFKYFQNDLSAQLNQPGENTEPGFGAIKKQDVPAGFFENFHANLQAEIEAENVFSELKLIKRQRPVVPGNFKADFTASVISEINIKLKRRRVLKITFWSTAAAVAAGLALLHSTPIKPILQVR